MIAPLPRLQPAPAVVPNRGRLVQYMLMVTAKSPGRSAARSSTERSRAANWGQSRLSVVAAPTGSWI